jgi:hypothetical protein
MISIIIIIVITIISLSPIAVTVDGTVSDVTAVESNICDPGPI